MLKTEGAFYAFVFMPKCSLTTCAKEGDIRRILY